jgi:hypothetical protein
MVKTLTVATEVQKAVFENVLMGEIATGFWKNARPADHADYWKGVSVVVGAQLGVTGFDAPRNYNFVNPEFFQKTRDSLMAAAASVNPNVTEKQLKKQLIALNQIIGSRLKEIGGSVTKLQRGRKQVAVTQVTQTVEKKNSKVTVKKVLANLVDA